MIRSHLTNPLYVIPSTRSFYESTIRRIVDRPNVPLLSAVPPFCGGTSILVPNKEVRNGKSRSVSGIQKSGLLSGIQTKKQGLDSRLSAKKTADAKRAKSAGMTRKPF